MTPSLVDSSLDPLVELMIRDDVNFFSNAVLGAPYDQVSRIIYPQPKYRRFFLKKKSGGDRLILEPRKSVKALQVRALQFLKERAHAPKSCVHGFVDDRSIVTNAKQHIDRKPHHLLNLDLEDFFPSITFYRVRGVFKGAPFNCSHEVATVLAQLCTFQNSLPQGAPTSPFISNLVCRSLDRDMKELARKHRATYTRYADDITFSFSVRDVKRLPESLCTYEGGVVTLGSELTSTIEGKHHFKINARKTRVSGRDRRMEVTGLTINEFVNVKRVYIDRIRGALHAWEKHGYVKSQQLWEQRIRSTSDKPPHERPWARQRRSKAIPQLCNVLWGKLLHLRMVRGPDDSIYTRLAEKYNALRLNELNVNNDFNASSLPVEMVVRNTDDAERSTYVIEWAGDYTAPGSSTTHMVGGQGTAFPYGTPQRLITCDHVLIHDLQIGGQTVAVDLQSPHVSNLMLDAFNPKTGARLPLKIVQRAAAPVDLAQLEITGGLTGGRYFAGLDAPINRGEAGFLLGFPNWSPGKLSNQARAVVHSRYPRSALQRFEVSVNIRQGNSGGPFVDEAFRVAGVAQQGSSQTEGNDECICVAELDKWVGP